MIQCISSLATISFRAPDTSESDSDSAHTALAPPPTVPQDSSTPQFSPPSVSSASLPGSPTMSEAFDARLAHLEQTSQSQSKQLAEILAALQGQNLPPPPPQLPSQHPTRPPSSASSSTPPSHHSSRASHAKASPPGIFDGQHDNSQVWWTSAIIYASTVHFEDDIAKIMWALSYFQTGCAATYRQSLIDHGHLYSSSRFDTWQEFEAEFIKEFMPEDECTQASLTLEGVSYFQGTASVDEYVDNFCALITINVEPVLYSTNPNAPTIKARLEDTKHVGQTVVLKFRHGLQPALEKKVAEAEARPQEWDTMAWYFLAKRFDKHEWEDAIFRGAQRSVHPGPPKPTFPSRAQPQGHSLLPIQFPTPAAAPIPAPCAPAPAQAPLSKGIPMEVDALRQRFLAHCTCYTCGKTGHFSAACPDCQHEHVRIVDMSVDDWQEIAEAYAAFQDFQAALMNEPAQEDFAKDQE
ncbi:hypothetical protein D9758_009820 [Tetrapyrgos nigripes]|uniref:CCHC-type domain-containing protein n=1 Tax=Tetrapyrgos nigripes TaxID=182062 RepID=A0A8H5GMR6_9AGAR|nr:hypothetical protein D9758_009820 [Tetrapyrgos nigripes]